MFIAVTWIVLLAMPTVPHVEVVKPGLEPVVDGADQPAGTATVISPALIARAAV
jgi:hypothetical protein